MLREVDSPYFEQVSAIEIDFAARLIDAAVGQAFSTDELERRAVALMEMMYALVTSGRTIQTGVPVEEYARTMADVLVLGTLHRPADAAPLDLFSAVDAATQAVRVS